MHPICNILVIVDPTADRHPAVEKGALLAEKFHARLELLVCDTKAAREARLAAHARTRSSEPFVVDLKAVLETLAAPLRLRGLDVTTECTRGDPLHAALMERIQQTTAELVIKDTHHHTLAQRTFLTNTDWQLIRGCPVPLLLTKSKPWAVTPRVVAAIDPSHVNDKPAVLDRRILDQSLALCRRLGGELYALHVYLPVVLMATADSMPPLVAAVTPQDLKREHEANLRSVSALASDYGVNVDHIHLQIGGPADALPRCAGELNADIVVMGAISRTGLKRIFIGSTAEDALERLPCDALIVKTPDFSDVLPG